MSRRLLLAGIAWLGSIALLGYQLVNWLMSQGGSWKNYSIIDFIDPNHFQWIDQISFTYLQKGAEYITTMPLVILLFCIGLLISFLLPS